MNSKYVGLLTIILGIICISLSVVPFFVSSALHITTIHPAQIFWLLIMCAGGGGITSLGVQMYNK